MLPPLSHGWAYEGAGSRGGGRKDEANTLGDEGDRAPVYSWWGRGPIDIARLPEPEAEKEKEEVGAGAKQLWPGAVWGDEQGEPGGVDMPRKEAVDTEGEGDKAAKEPEPEHRMLPPLSHGWAYEGAGSRGGGRKDAVDSQQEQEGGVEPVMPRKEEAAMADEHEHRKLPPLSHGWAYEGGSSSRGGRKDAVDSQQQQQGGDNKAAVAEEEDGGKL
jgi:hypothetical protein